MFCGLIELRVAYITDVLSSLQILKVHAFLTAMKQGYDW